MYTECLQEVELRQQYNATGVAQTEKVVALNTQSYLCYGVPRFLKPLSHCTTTFAVAYQICSQQRFLNMKHRKYMNSNMCATFNFADMFELTKLSSHNKPPIYGLRILFNSKFSCSYCRTMLIIYSGKLLWMHALACIICGQTSVIMQPQC